MPIEKQFSLLELERKRSVNQLARAWGENGVLRSPETPRLDFERPGLSGKQLISRLLCSAQDLEGRVVGRNNDDASFLCKGLGVLLQEWDALETTVHESQQILQQYQSRRQEAALIASPESSDTQYAAKQNSRIQQLEKQEERLLGELKDVKTSWEAIMAKTMEHQASIHRQQMREREVLVAQKDAELESMRQRMSGSRSQASEQSQPQQVQRRREEMGPSEGDRSQPRPDKYLMTGRMVVGQTLQILGPTDENAREKYQWYQIDPHGDWIPISGATRNQYSPEPGDWGFAIGCTVAPPNSEGSEVVKRISSKRAVALPSDMEEWVEAMIEADGYQFGVVVVQKNGMLHTNREVCTLDVNAHNLQLRLPNDLVLQQPYTAAMQVCGARGAGSAAAQGVFLAMRPHEVYMLACETPRDRNACIMLIRKMAGLHGLRLRGP